MIGRANVNRYPMRVKHKVDPTDVFVYEDHRYTLNALRHGRAQGIFNGPVNLVYFDYHDDAINPTSPAATRTGYRQNMPSVRDFWQFVEWEVSSGDDDWLKTGMDVGLIQDAL